MEKAMVTPMDRHRSRPFGLGDAMIFIVALALGLALAQGDCVLKSFADNEIKTEVPKKWEK